MDRQRRKQAEFLVHKFCPWPVIQEVGVMNTQVKGQVEEILEESEPAWRPVVNVRASWYY
jgi:hypothetical protein